MGDLYALDFDGILCDSCGESSLSAIKAAKLQWPYLFKGVNSDSENWIIEQMHIVRPVVETGYENVLLVRLLLEIQFSSNLQSTIAKGLTVDGILESWISLKPVIMDEWGQTREGLIEVFGKIRDDWIKNDLPGWIASNRLYPGIADALNFASSKIFVITTKSSKLVDILLRGLAGVTIPMDRIFGLESGPKTEVLKKLQKDPKNIGLTFHFVEDRLATLKNIMDNPELNCWNLYLGKWGYNIPKERDAAGRIARINLLELSDFCNKLR